MTLVRSVVPLQEPSIRRERNCADSLALLATMANFSFFAIMISLLCKIAKKINVFNYHFLTKITQSIIVELYHIDGLIGLAVQGI